MSEACRRLPAPACGSAPCCYHCGVLAGINLRHEDNCMLSPVSLSSESPNVGAVSGTLKPRGAKQEDGDPGGRWAPSGNRIKTVSSQNGISCGLCIWVALATSLKTSVPFRRVAGCMGRGCPVRAAVAECRVGSQRGTVRGQAHRTAPCPSYAPGLQWASCGGQPAGSGPSRLFSAVRRTAPRVEVPFLPVVTMVTMGSSNPCRLATPPLRLSLLPSAPCSRAAGPSWPQGGLLWLSPPPRPSTLWLPPGVPPGKGKTHLDPQCFEGIAIPP